MDQQNEFSDASLADLHVLIDQLQHQISSLKTSPSCSSTSISTSVGGLPETKQFNGSNWMEWKFWMKNFLIDCGLWNCVQPPLGFVIDPDLDQRALAKINLSIKPHVTSETRKACTAKQAWDLLKKTYEDSGTVRIVNLYSKLFKIDYNKCKSMQDYLEQMSNIAEQLENVGQPFPDHVFGGIILGGLPEEFRPLILGIQGSSQITSTEFVKNLLLQENLKESKPAQHPSTDMAYHTNFKNKYRGKNNETRWKKGFKNAKRNPNFSSVVTQCNYT